MYKIILGGLSIFFITSSYGMLSKSYEVMNVIDEAQKEQSILDENFQNFYNNQQEICQATQDFLLKIKSPSPLLKPDANGLLYNKTKNLLDYSSKLISSQSKISKTIIDAHIARRKKKGAAINSFIQKMKQEIQKSEQREACSKKKLNDGLVKLREIDSIAL